MLTAIEQAAEAAPDMMKRIEDISHLNLDDAELQEAFYHMLKGTISKDKLEEIELENSRMKEKSYISLLTFINFNGASSTPKIVVQHAPREILKAIFVNDEIVEAIVARRKELTAGKDNGGSTAFANEFKDKRRPGLDDALLDFKITIKRDIEGYN
jgi:hypothetical protein